VFSAPPVTSGSVCAQTRLIAPFLGMLIARAALRGKGTLFYIPLSSSLLNAPRFLAPDLL
jgi:hypothetical protein